jgi:hypothetical protein
LLARSAGLLGICMLLGCGASTSVTLEQVDGSGVTGVADLYEAIGKSVSYRVDMFVSVDEPTPPMTTQMRAVIRAGTCAAPGETLPVTAMVHRRGEGGAAEVMLNHGRLGDLSGHSVHIHAGEPDASPRLACGEIVP